MYKKKQVWEIILQGTENDLEENDDDYFPTIDQVKNKWKALISSYKSFVDRSNKSGNGAETPPPYYNEISEVYGYRPNVAPVATIDSANPKIKRKNSNIEKPSFKKAFWVRFFS